MKSRLRRIPAPRDNLRILTRHAWRVGAIRSGGKGSRDRVARALMKIRGGERIWKTGKQENRSFAVSVPVFLLSRFICSKEQMALRCIGGRRSAERDSAKTVRNFQSHPGCVSLLALLHRCDPGSR